MATKTTGVKWSDVNVIYQIYPRSFQDSDDNGIGDLRGVTSRLDYLVDILGVGAIWFSPFFPSPMADFGYDVKDYCDIDPIFGTLDDFRSLLSAAHERGLKVMIDFVPNHTSSEHPWFAESRSSCDSPKRDYYVWRDPKPDGSAPNNWLSIFGGPAWEYDKKTGQYYLHTFLKEQPDLNWDNPEVREQMKEVLHFWFKLGVDGIRADAVRWISKDQELRNDPLNPKYKPKRDSDEFWSLLHTNSRFGKNLFPYLRELTDVVAAYPNRIMVFEDYPDEVYSIHDQYLGFYSVNPKVSMPFNFDGMGLPFAAEAYQNFVSEFQGMLDPKQHTPVYCFGNHDQPRLASRVGSEQARLIALMQLCLPGLPVVYYGDELGMENGVIRPEEVQDPVELRKPGLNQGRDPERTPMQWDDSEYAGFSRVKSWLPLAADAATRTVKAEQDDPDSFLSVYRRLLQLRSQYRVFRSGEYKALTDMPEQVFAFSRRIGKNGQHIFVALNFGHEPISVDLQHVGRVLCCTHPVNPPVFLDDGTLQLAAYGGAVIECGDHPLDGLPVRRHAV